MFLVKILVSSMLRHSSAFSFDMLMIVRGIGCLMRRLASSM